MSLRKRTNLTDSEINQILFATPVEESEGESFELESEDEFNPPPEDVESDTYDDIQFMWSVKYSQMQLLRKQPLNLELKNERKPLFLVRFQVIRSKEKMVLYGFK